MKGPGAPVYLHDSKLRRRLERNLGRFTPSEDAESGSHVAAAVVIAVVRSAGAGASFLITRRSAALRAHAGQYALPGGKVATGESVEQAGLRELGEELRPSAPFEVVGRLDTLRTRSGYAITPVVAWCPAAGLVLHPDPGEVASVHLVPLDELLAPGSPAWIEMGGMRVMRMRMLGHWIHSPTAAILYQFREVALHGHAVRIPDAGEPPFAWR